MSNMGGNQHWVFTGAYLLYSFYVSTCLSLAQAVKSWSISGSTDQQDIWSCYPSSYSVSLFAGVYPLYMGQKSPSTLPPGRGCAWSEVPPPLGGVPSALLHGRGRATVAKSQVSSSSLPRFFPAFCQYSSSASSYALLSFSEGVRVVF